MEIMSFKRKKGSVYEIELNTGEKHKLYDDVILKYELLLNRKISQKILDDVLGENALLDAYFRALKYISIKMRTEIEIEEYLKRYDYQDREITYAVERLKKEGAIDNKRYVAAYINDALLLSLDGPKKIKVSLGKLGIGDYLIDSVLEGVSDSEWKSRIEKVVLKKAKVNKDSEKMFKLKTTNALVALGYPIELIKSVIDDFKLNTEDAFLKEAEKVYRKLEGKYEGTELELRFKSKMYAKGYEGDKIMNYLNNK